MTAEERQMLADLFTRIRAAGATARDAQAEAFITDAVRATPYAPYVMAQTVLVQQQALEAAAKRIQGLETASQGGAPQVETSFLGGIGKALFGAPAQPAPGTAQPYRPAAQPQYAAQAPYAQAPQPGPWGAPAGGGFLQGALRTAAGVAGGVALAEMFGGLLGGHGGGGLFGGGAAHETINNFYETPQGGGTSHASESWVDPGTGGGGFSQDAGFSDSGGFDGSGSDGGMDA